MMAPRLALVPVLGLTLAKLGLHLLTRNGYGIFRDELYYLACAKQLAWGYVDHPPLSIALLSAQTALLGDSLPALRLLPALAGAAVVFGAAWLARELGGRRSAQGLAALATLVSPYLLAVSHFYSMNIFSALFWTLLAAIAIRALQRDEPRLWLLFGAVAGLALLNKWLVGVFSFGIVVGLLLTQARRHLASPWIWAGGAIAGLLFAPHLAWQFANGWPTLEFSAAAAELKNQRLTTLGLFLEQIPLANPMTFPLWLTGAIGLGFSPHLRSVRVLGWATAVVFVIFASVSGKAYYLAAIYPLLFAAGAVVFEAAAVRRDWRWAMPVYATSLAIAGVLLLPIAVPVLPADTVANFLTRTGLSVEGAGERHEQGRLPQNFADMHGWEALATQVAEIAHSLSTQERAGLVVIAGNYGQAGAIEYWGRQRGLPPAISGHNNYYLWGTKGWQGRTAIVVGQEEAVLREWFKEVEQVATTDCGDCMPNENGRPIFLARGLRIPIEEFWLANKRFR